MTQKAQMKRGIASDSTKETTLGTFRSPGERQGLRSLDSRPLAWGLLWLAARTHPSITTIHPRIVGARRFLMVQDKTAAADILMTSGTRQVAAVYNNEGKNRLSVAKESHKLPTR